MAVKFLPLPALKLHDQIVMDLADPVLRQQGIRYAMDPKEFAKNLLKICIDNRCSPWPFVKHYGILLQRLGYFYTVPVPNELAQRVKTQWKFLKDMPEPPVIRLQIIHSGQQVPLHIDASRSVSLIYPILNHDTARTNFYNAKKSLPRGMVNPDDCEYQQSVTISEYPVLLNVDQPHDVTYSNNSVTPTRPRVSFNLKWQHMTFEQVLPYFESYSC